METGATIVVTVRGPAAADNQPLIFLDDQLNRDDQGNVKTSFAPGDRVYVLLQIPAGQTVDDVRSSDGTLNPLGLVTRQQTDQLTIESDAKTVSLSKNPAGSLEPGWYGNSGSMSIDGKNLTITGDLPAIVDLTYSYQAISYLLTGPDVELDDNQTWPVRVTAYTPEDGGNANNCAA